MLLLKSTIRLGTLAVVALSLTLMACQPEPVQPKSEDKVETADGTTRVQNDQPPKDTGGGKGS